MSVVEEVLGESLKKYKQKAKKIAEDFNYPFSVLTDIENASTEFEIANILTTARKKYL